MLQKFTVGEILADAIFQPMSGTVRESNDSALHHDEGAKDMPAKPWRKSAAILLVLSGGLLAGCNRNEPLEAASSQPLTNNTYHASRGYYHAPYHGWFPFPYNHHRPGVGYYHGGSVTPSPHQSSITASLPQKSPSSSHTSRGGFGRHLSGIS
jgi:hypothetical protein